MKKQIKKTFVLLTAIIACFSMPNKLNAQTIPTNTAVNCSFYIYNHRNCDVTVNYEVSDCNANLPVTPPGPCGSGVICNNSALHIPANTSVNTICCIQNPNPAFPSPPCYSPGGDVFVWLKEIDSIDVTGGSSSQAVSGLNCLSSGGLTGSGTLPAGIPSPCNSPSTYKIVWTSNGVDIY